jgi:fusion protein PurCD
MTKNAKLSENLLTPTTKEEEHDRPISAEEIIQEGWMTEHDFKVCAQGSPLCIRSWANEWRPNMV